MTPVHKARKSGRALLQAVFLFSVFVNLLMLTGPLFMLQIYDRVLRSGSEETLVALFILVAVLYGLMALLDYARGRVLARFGARFQAQLDADMFKQSLRDAVDPKLRAKPAKGINHLEMLQQFFTSPALLAICDLPWTPIFLILIFVFHPLLGWLALAGGGALVVLTALNHVLSRSQTQGAQTASMAAAGLAEEARSHAEIIHSQGMGQSILSRWLHQRARGLDQALAASDLTGVFTATTKAFRLFLQSAILALGAYLVLQGQMTAGAMIAGSILLGRALAPIEQSIGSWPLIQRSMIAWRDLSELLEAEAPEQIKTQLPPPEARLKLRKVSLLAAGRSEPILAQIDFTLHPGDAVGVIGKSGAGKSSFARVILGLSPPSAGEVLLGGAHIGQYDTAALGNAIGYLPQQVRLFPASLAENIARMSETIDEAALIAAAQKARVHDLITGLPQGYDTQLGKHDVVLSGGQMQRLALARALYSDPVLLVLDEPNSALDAEGTEALNQCIRDFKADSKAVILMTHRPMAIAECDRLIVMDQGRIRADGPRDEILKSMVKNAGQIQKFVQSEGAA